MIRERVSRLAWVPPGGVLIGYLLVGLSVITREKVNQRGTGNAVPDTFTAVPDNLLSFVNIC